MPKERNEFVPVRLDSRGQRVAEDQKGTDYINVLDWTNLTPSQRKNRNPRRFLLTDKNDVPIPYDHFEFKPRKSSTGGRVRRSDSACIRMIQNAVTEFKTREEIGNVLVNPDGVEITVSGNRKISDLWLDYVENMRIIISRKTKKRIPESTIRNRGYSLKHYLETFGDHSANDFPPNVGEDFMLKSLASERVDCRSGEKLKPLALNTVRTYVTDLNQFLQWCIRKKLIKKAPVLELPTRDPSYEPKIPTLSERDMVETELRKLVAKWKPKYKTEHYISKRRTTREFLYRNLLRFYILADYGAMRRSEVWALKREDIDLDERKIYIYEKDEDGGTDRYGKPVRVKFRPKSGRSDFILIDDYMMEFLIEDEEARGKDEVWYLDKGDGSINWNGPNLISDAMAKILKKLGIYEKGQVLHWFRRARNMDLVDGNPHHGQHHLRHSNMRTNEAFYQTHKKPDGLLESLNESNKRRHSVN